MVHTDKRTSGISEKFRKTMVDGGQSISLLKAGFVTFRSIIDPSSQRSRDLLAAIFLPTDLTVLDAMRKTRTWQGTDKY
jgi:hypothetical protein